MSILHTAPSTEIIQKRGKTTTRYTLKSNDELEMETSSKDRGETFRIDLRKVSEKPSRQRFQAGYLNRSAFLRLAIATIFFVSSVLALFNGMWALAVFFSIFFVPCTLLGINESRKFRATSYDILVFENRLGGSAFAIESNKPDTETLEAFLKNLTAAITTASPDPITLNGEDKLSGQIAKLHDLFKQGLLNEEEYATAKARVLSKAVEGERTIGFSSMAG